MNHRLFNNIFVQKSEKLKQSLRIDWLPDDGFEHVTLLSVYTSVNTNIWRRKSLD